MSLDDQMSGVRDFDFLIGKWRVRHKTLVGRLIGANDWVEADAIDVVRPAFAGLGNVGKFIRFVDDKPYEGMPTRLYDPRLGQWRIWWLDTTDHRMEPPLLGGFSDGDGLFEGVDTLCRRPIRVRFTWTEISEDFARWDQSFSDDDGASWELNSIMEFTRDESLPDEPSYTDL